MSATRRVVGRKPVPEKTGYLHKNKREPVMVLFKHKGEFSISYVQDATYSFPKEIYDEIVLKLKAEGHPGVVWALERLGHLPFGQVLVDLTGVPVKRIPADKRESLWRAEDSVWQARETCDMKDAVIFLTASSDYFVLDIFDFPENFDVSKMVVYSMPEHLMDAMIADYHARGRLI